MIVGRRTSRPLWAALLLAIGALTAGFARHNTVTAPFFFIQASDPQFGMYTADSSFTQETANFEFLVATANRLHPAFLVVTGDLINRPGDSAQAAEYWRIAKQLDPSIPLYNVPGNHDVGNTPTPASVATYVQRFGPDRYVFKHGDFVGVVINSTIIDSAQSVPVEFAAQEQWLEAELSRARVSGARHIVIFEHHPWFLTSATEPDQYFNLPLVHRVRYLAMFHKYGVDAVFAGHYHRNSLAQDGTMLMVTTGPVGRPFGDSHSGIRIVTVADSGISHRYYDFGDIPNRVVVK